MKTNIAGINYIILYIIYILCSYLYNVNVKMETQGQQSHHLTIFVCVSMGLGAFIPMSITFQYISIKVLFLHVLFWLVFWTRGEIMHSYFCTLKYRILLLIKILNRNIYNFIINIKCIMPCWEIGFWTQGEIIHSYLLYT